MSRYNNSICSDEAPGWETIGERLKMLNIIDYKLASRLKHEEAEHIFFNLFLKIDPVDCRKKFRSIYPTRSNEDRIRFMDTAANFINDRHLSHYKIVASHLKVLGGEPFRRIMSAVIDEASKKRKYFENLIPRINIDPLLDEQTAIKSQSVKFAELEKILAEWPNEHYRDVIETTRKLFSKE